MREIEIKLEVPCYSSARDKLLRHGWVPLDKLHQADFIYLHGELEFDQIKVGTPVTRLRIQNANEYLLNVKVSKTNELDCIEHESKVESALETRKILHLLGMKEVMKVTKQRESGTLDGYTVCLDRVEGLGVFVEFEILVVDDDLESDQIKNKMFIDIAKIGLDFGKEITSGYDTLLYKKMISKSFDNYDEKTI